MRETPDSLVLAPSVMLLGLVLLDAHLTNKVAARYLERKENERRALDETLNKLPDDKLRSRSDRWVR